ncbi:unnamed protein product [Ixodes pacificus]
MESHWRGGRRGQGGRLPRGGGFGRGTSRGVPSQVGSYSDRSKGTAFNWKRRGNRGFRDFREACGQAEGTSSGENWDSADSFAERQAVERPLLSGHDDLEEEHGIERRTEVSHSNTESLPVRFTFPSFEELTTGSRSNATACSNVFDLAECALVNHTHDCFLKAYKLKVNASLGDLTVVPQRGLGRKISVTIGDDLRQGPIGHTVALVDTKQQSVHYGEIEQVGKEQVVLFHNCVEILDIPTTYAYTMVDTNLKASFCLELSSVLASRRESLLLRKLWLGPRDPVGGKRSSSIPGLQCLKTPVVLDRSQSEAFRAGVSEDVALIHAPSGCGSKTLLKAMVDYLCLNEQSLNKQPLLLIVKNPLELQVKLGWTSDDVFNMNGEPMCQVKKAAQESFEAVMALGEVKATSAKVRDLLLQMYDAETTILHQSLFEGITRAFSLKRKEEKNLVQIWLFDNVRYEEMRSSVTQAEFRRFQEHCKRRPANKADAAAEPMNEDVCFTFSRSSEAWSDPDDQTFIPRDRNSLMAAYVWKTLTATDPSADLMSVKNIRELELSDRWRLYKHWVALFLNMKENELRKTLQHLATSTERYKKVWMEGRTCLKLSQPVIMASSVTAVTHRALLEVLRPRVTIVCDATTIEDFYVPALIPQSTEKAIFIGDGLNPYQASYSCWRRLLESENFPVRELECQYFQSQDVCTLLSPFLKCIPISIERPQRMNGIRETVQFFNIPDINEAAFMISRLCVHLQAYNYESSDIAVLVLSPRQGALKTLKLALLKQKCTYSVYSAISFYPRRCKIAVVYVGPGSLGTQLAAALNRTSFAVYGFGVFSKPDESCQNILNTAKVRNEDLLNGSLSLMCICHPGKVISVASRHDFETKINSHGLCIGPCSDVLSCGHARKVVHHEGRQLVASCQQLCRRTICKRNHVCPNNCSAPCIRLCTQLSTEKLPSCGHDITLPCHQLDAVLNPQECRLDVNSPPSSRKQPHEPYECNQEVTKKRPCGHLIKTRCCISLFPRCEEFRDDSLPRCGHLAKLACYVWDDPASLIAHECTQMVTVKASCGHHLSVACHVLDYRVEGRPCLPDGHRCTYDVTKKAPCGHLVKAKCFESASSPCQKCEEDCHEPYNQHGLHVSDRSGHDASPTKTHRPSQEATTKMASRGGLVSGGGTRSDELVEVITRPCGHRIVITRSFSSGDPTLLPCDEMVVEVRPCGHLARRLCHKTLALECPVPTSKTLTCGHIVLGPCWYMSRGTHACRTCKDRCCMM